MQRRCGRLNTDFIFQYKDRNAGTVKKKQVVHIKTEFADGSRWQAEGHVKADLHRGVTLGDTCTQHVLRWYWTSGEAHPRPSIVS